MYRTVRIESAGQTKCRTVRTESAGQTKCIGQLE